MLDLADAQAIVRQSATPGAIQTVPLQESLHRTLASPVYNDGDYPPFDRATMDGFAVRCADVRHAPTTLQWIGEAAAGAATDLSVAPGTAVRIATGAMIPHGADAVVRIEATEILGEGRVVILETAHDSQFIQRRAAASAAGALVLDSGRRMTPCGIAAAAAAGASRVAVYRQCTVGILATGSELIDAGSRPQGSQIRNCNGPLLRALAESMGCRVMDLGFVIDDAKAIAQAIRNGLVADVLCVTGGVSMGAFDLAPEAIAACGARVLFHGVSIKPGRPTLFAAHPEGTLIFGLPGNPISALIGFEYLVRIAISIREGLGFQPPQRERALLVGELGATGARRSFWPLRIESTGGDFPSAIPLRWQGSGDPIGVGGANALLEREPQSPLLGPGTKIWMHRLSELR